MVGHSKHLYPQIPTPRIVTYNVCGYGKGTDAELRQKLFVNLKNLYLVADIILIQETLTINPNNPINSNTYTRKLVILKTANPNSGHRDGTDILINKDFAKLIDSSPLSTSVPNESSGPADCCEGASSDALTSMDVN